MRATTTTVAAVRAASTAGSVPFDWKPLATVAFCLVSQVHSEQSGQEDATFLVNQFGDGAGLMEHQVQWTCLPLQLSSGAEEDVAASLIGGKILTFVVDTLFSPLWRRQYSTYILDGRLIGTLVVFESYSRHPQINLIYIRR